MNGLSTITQKGQVVIPHQIRKLLNLKPATKLSFGVVGRKIIAEPVMTIDDAVGMIKADRYHTDEEFEEAIIEAVVEKYKSKNK